MKWFDKKDRRTMLEKEIDVLSEKMEKIEDKTSDEYKDYVAMMDKLIKLNKDLNNPGKEREKLSPNAVFSACVSFAEIVFILHYEQAHVIATKALGRIWRGRV